MDKLARTGRVDIASQVIRRAVLAACGLPLAHSDMAAAASLERDAIKPGCDNLVTGNLSEPHPLSKDWRHWTVPPGQLALARMVKDIVDKRRAVRTLRWLEAWRGEQGLELIVVDSEGNRKWQRRIGRGRYAKVMEVDPLRPDAGTAILVLSDLGAASGDPVAMARWARWALEAEREEARVHALLPCSLGRVDGRLAARFGAVEWESARLLGAPTAQARPSDTVRRGLVDQLFVMLSPAVRVDWALLRAMRRLLPVDLADVGVELDASLDSRAAGLCDEGFVIEYGAAKSLRLRFAELSEARRTEVAGVFRRVHGHLGLAMRAEEQWVWGNEAERQEAEADYACYVKYLCAQRTHDRGREQASSTARAYAERFQARRPLADWASPAFAGYWAVHHARGNAKSFDGAIPEGMDEQEVLWALSELPQPSHCEVWQRGNTLRLLPAGAEAEPTSTGAGTCLGVLPCVLRELRVLQRPFIGEAQVERVSLAAPVSLELPGSGAIGHLWLRTELGEMELVRQYRPPWASAFYRDAEGLWVEATLRGFEAQVTEKRTAPVEPSPFRRTETAQATKKPPLFQRLLRPASEVPLVPPEPLERPGPPLASIAIVERRVRQRLLFPTWGTRLDQDDYGLYAELKLSPTLTTRLRWIPPGSFQMGSSEGEVGRFDVEGPQHRVELRRGFWLCEAPCTQGEWEAVMGQNPSYFKDNPEEARQRPVEQVSWEECQEFCRKLNERLGGLGARLPSEAEWEYACRAGTVNGYNDGSESTKPEGADPALERLGWFSETSERGTHPVRELAPNAWGLYDMHGNVYEWCADLWSDKYNGGDEVDPVGPQNGSYRVIRGGCWDSRAQRCRSAFRGGGRPASRGSDVGLRFAAGLVSPGEGKEQGG